MDDSCRPNQNSFFYFSSDSASCSETDEDTDVNSCQVLPSKADAVKLSKQSKRHYEFVLNSTSPQKQDSTCKPVMDSNNSSKNMVSAPFCKPRSSRLRPYPYITPTNFDQPSGKHKEVLQLNEIDRKINKQSILFCLEEHLYDEYRHIKSNKTDHRTDFEHEPTVLGDLGPMFSKKVTITQAELNTKKKNREKEKNKNKTESSKDTLEEINEKSRQIAFLCDSMPNIMPPIRCYYCKDWIKSSSFSRHIFDHIIQDKQAFPSDDKHNWCAHCNRSFDSDFELRDHYMMASIIAQL